MPETIQTAKLDEHLKEVVRALHSAVTWAIPHAKEEKIAGKAIVDCKEILDVVMEGKVSEWLD
jgi:hypothetical protein